MSSNPDWVTNEVPPASAETENHFQPDNENNETAVNKAQDVLHQIGSTIQAATQQDNGSHPFELAPKDPEQNPIPEQIVQGATSIANDVKEAAQKAAQKAQEEGAKLEQKANQLGEAAKKFVEDAKKTNDIPDDLAGSLKETNDHLPNAGNETTNDKRNNIVRNVGICVASAVAVFLLVRFISKRKH